MRVFRYGLHLSNLVTIPFCKQSLVRRICDCSEQGLHAILSSGEEGYCMFYVFIYCLITACYVLSPS